MSTKQFPLEVNQYKIYERLQNGTEEYLCIIYLIHHRDGSTSVSSIHISNYDERDNYHKQMEGYFREIAEEKHLPITLDNLDTIYLYVFTLHPMYNLYIFISIDIQVGII